MNLSIKGLYLGLAALVCLLLFSGMVAHQHIRQLRVDTAWVTHTHEVLEALEAAKGTLTDAVTSQRGYLLTGDRAYLDLYLSSAAAVWQEIERVKTLTRGNDRQRSRVEQLERLGAEELALLQATIAQRERDPAAARLGLGKPVMDAFRGQVAAMEQDERSLLPEREQTSRRGFRVAVAFGTVSTLLGLALVAALLFQLRRSLRENAVTAETLRASELRFRTAFEQGAIPTAIVALDGRVLEANAAMAEMLGYPQAELDRLTVGDLTCPEDQAATQSALDRLRSGGTRSFRMEKRYRHRDGRVLWGDMGTTAVPDPAGTAIHLVTHIQDITERKRAEEGLREANQRKDEFLATLAHELRNPLAPIRTGAHLLSRLPAPEQVRQIHDMIARQAAHMARLVDDLLDVSRIEQGRLELRKERVDPGQVAAQAVEACRPLIEAGGHEVTLGVAEGTPAIEADPVRLEQMLCNLLNNACKCTPAGGRIQVSTGAEGAEAVLKVVDNGIGMTPEVREHLFELFYQGARNGENGGGLGIGLTLVKRLAELHGGSVQAFSAGPGQGSEFQLRLPAPVLASCGNGPVPSEPAPGGQRRVLIIDDDPNVRSTLRMLLEAMDYAVTAAGTGAKGIEAALRERPDIALVDLAMPDMTGLEVAAAIRAQLGQGIRLVALTGYSRDSDFASTQAAGFDQHLVKSGDPRELLAALAAVG